MHLNDIELAEKLKAKNICPNNNEKILYKYVNVGDAIKILDGCTLLYQAPVNFNDPFEMHLGLLDLKQSAKDSFWRTIPKNLTKVEIDFLLGKMPFEDFVRIIEDILANQREKTGVLCLSKTNVSTLMWSHYSNKHTGVCLGFRMANNFPQKGVAAFEVNYATSVMPIKYNFGDGSDDISAFIYWICTKSHVWSYEQEVRVINIDQAGLLPFNKYQLCELYFGVGTTQEDVNLITDIIRNIGYRLYCIGKMFIDKNTFDLKPRYFHPYISDFPTKLPRNL